MIAGHRLICRFSLVLLLAALSTGTQADELLVYLEEHDHPALTMDPIF